MNIFDILDSQEVILSLKLESTSTELQVLETLLKHVQTNQMGLRQTMDLLVFAHSMNSIPILNEAIILLSTHFKNLGAVRCYYTCVKIKDIVYSCKKVSLIQM